MDRENFLELSGFRYLKLAAAVTAVCIAAYVIDAPRTVPKAVTISGSARSWPRP